MSSFGALASGGTRDDQLGDCLVILHTLMAAMHKKEDSDVVETYEDIRKAIH